MLEWQNTQTKYQEDEEKRWSKDRAVQSFPSETKEKLTKVNSRRKQMRSEVVKSNPVVSWDVLCFNI